LGNGENVGISLSYAAQAEPRGIAEAFTIGAEFIGGDNVCLILGDNIFYGQGFVEKLKLGVEREAGATVLAYKVSDPQRYGVIEVDADMRALSISEKPESPRSHWVVTGLYFYDNDVIDIARDLELSARGELEITDVNRVYLERGMLDVLFLGRGFAWLDTGTHDSLLEASEYVQTIERRQGMKIACLEEIAFVNGWLTASEVSARAEAMEKSDYGHYLMDVISGQEY
jgi:glucose-1-phosphate thymidylyltransferase